MKKLYAVFPNIKLKKPCTISGIKFTGFYSSYTLTTNELIAMVEWNYKDDIEEKAAIRQLKVLKCHLMIAARLSGDNPLIVGKIITWNEGIDKPKVIPATTVKVPLSTLIKYFPRELEETELTVCWYANYLEQSKDDERAKIFRLYNALGTLPCGFEGIKTLSSNTEDIKVMDRLLKRIDDFHTEDSEDENYVSKTLPLSNVEIRKIEDFYLHHLKVFYPFFN